jgi:hypothetical protein
VTDRPPDSERPASREAAPRTAANASRGHEARTGAQSGLQSAAALAAGVAERVRRAGVVGVLVLLLGAAGGVALFAAELSTLYEIEVQEASCEDFATPGDRDECLTKGIEQHSGALIVLGLLALPMALAAGAARSRPAAIALLAIGVVVLAIALIGDLPDIDETGQIGITFEEAKAEYRIGLVLELVGAGLCAAAGALALMLGRR